MTDQITPAQLSSELGVSAKAIREYLRAKHGTLPPFVSRWNLTKAQADDARKHSRTK